ncbi:MAG TPA: hypothetical protein VG937_19180 [Polyangiaceae bacterium]|nr:hypothetical protein [Polyangiaceae bacterium]
MKGFGLGLRCALVALGLSLLSACSGGKAERKGQIMLALQTDMSIPDDVSHVRILVFKNGALKFDQKYRVGADGEEIPATLGIIASDNASDTTEVRVLSYQGATVRTLNRAVTTIPQDRIATLRVPIQWLCDGQVKPTEGVPDSYDSSCKNPDEACVAGECRRVKVDSATLPDYRAQEISGGSADPAHGLCFDTVPCLDSGRDVVPDAQCRLALPPAEVNNLNVALRLPPGRAGICNQTGNCYVPLDRGENGWQLEPGAQSPARVLLPSAVCDRLASGDAQAVRVSSACLTKTEQTPTCGPWTSVGTQNPDKGPLDPGSMTGTPGNGVIPDPNSTCPQLYMSSSPPLSADPLVDHFDRLSIELAQAVNRVRSDVGQACSSIVLRLTGRVTTFAGAVPTDAEAVAACNAAQLELTNRQAETEVSLSPGSCRSDAAEQLSLEASCQLGGCSVGTFAERCSSRLTSCNGSCFGACSPGPMMLNVACQGHCSGQCDGSCDGNCTGPGGNPLPASDCLGLCDGTCSGTCQGDCMSDASCLGTCRGECQGSVVTEYCESPLTLPSCAMTDGCANLAAATGGLHQQCTPGSVFVAGPTPPEVAPAISDNTPRLFQAIQQANGYQRAASYLDGAGRSLGPAVKSADLSCFNEANKLVGPASVSLGRLVPAAQGVVSSLRAPGPLGPCSLSSADDSCAQCMKSSCCAELEACSASATCQEETKCMQGCAARGDSAASCQQQCAVSGGQIEASSAAYLSCQSGVCAQCNAPIAMCRKIDATGSLIDDFEDGDLVTTLGGWRVTNSNGFLGSLSNVTPGAGTTGGALGIFGSPDAGMSIDFGMCVDAVATGGIAFDASPQTATAPLALTVRVRTRSTEPSGSGGDCTTGCGDHFVSTLSLPPGGFSPYSLPWASLLNPLAMMADSRQIVGIDFVAFGSTDSQFAIDNLRFLPSP